MTVEDLVGDYLINGYNQDAVKSSYKGKLSLSLGATKRIDAVWNNSGHQVQMGTGFFRDQILVINFTYLGEQNQYVKGVVAYQCFSKNVLEGFWSEKHGDPLFLVAEQAFKLTENNLLLD